MDFNVRKLATDAGIFFSRAVQVRSPVYGYIYEFKRNGQSVVDSLCVARDSAFTPKHETVLQISSQISCTKNN